MTIEQATILAVMAFERIPRNASVHAFVLAEVNILGSPEDFAEFQERVANARSGVPGVTIDLLH
jgi:hypothetical protein